jgi:alpha-glucan,water dikinase
MQSSSPNAQVGEAIPSLSLVKKKFLGKYAISAEDFTDEMVIIQIYSLENVTF